MCSFNYKVKPIHMDLIRKERAEITMEGNNRSLLRKFCLESTILGLKYFYLYPDYVSRCFWLANMLGVLSLSFLLSWLLYIRFADMPTRITIENQFEPVNGLAYPAIILCSPNQITKSFVRHFNRTLVDGNLTIDLESVLPKTSGFFELLDDFDIKDMIQLQSLLDLNRYTVPEVMAAMPQSCESFLKLCYFNAMKYPNCETLFQPILTADGHCCAFNSIYHYKDKRNGRNPHFTTKKVTQAGIFHGLTVITDYDPEDAVDGTIQFSGSTKVLYTASNEFPSDDETNIIGTNVENYVGLYATHTYCSEDVKALPSWSRKCYMENEHRLPFFRRYHNSDCDLTCYALAVQEFCHCTLIFMPYLRAEGTCNLTSIPCIMEVKVRMSEWMTAAQCDCPRDCESLQYKADLSNGNLNAMPHLVYNPYADVKLNTSSSIIHFFFYSSVYMKKKQETVMSLISLASNLGGVFGLCLGCSVISLLEILFYVYVAVKNYVQSKFQRSNSVKNTENFK